VVAKKGEHNIDSRLEKIENIRTFPSNGVKKVDVISLAKQWHIKRWMISCSVQ
jgi:hypothetical protein